MIESSRMTPEEEYEKLEQVFDERIDRFFHMNYSPKNSPIAFLLFVLQSIFESRDFKLFKKKDGETVINKKGFPKINWLNVFSSIPKLVSELVLMFLAYKELKSTNTHVFTITEDMKSFDPPQEITDFYAYHKTLKSVNRLCDKIKLSEDETEKLIHLKQEGVDELIYGKIRTNLNERLKYEESGETITIIEKEMEGIVYDPLIRNQILIETVADIVNKTSIVLMSAPEEEVKKKIKEETLVIFEELQQIVESSIRTIKND